MAREGMDRGGHGYVSASEIAAMGMCERRMVLEHRHGRRLSAGQHEAVLRGRRLHAAFDAQAEAGQAGLRGRCFIATQVFGSTAPQTSVLRRYRDRVLRASAPGRCLIAWYYRAAPRVCAWLARHPWARVPVRQGLRLVVLYAHWRCSCEETDRGC
ncbi:hypothetical protein DelCs14_1842 [Delftia sp. Cs1-4]|nr:hypothetical protein DelCs14_1842 [Delftia sp. Cs1-4]